MGLLEIVQPYLPQFADKRSGFWPHVETPYEQFIFLERDFIIGDADVRCVREGSLEPFTLPEYASPLDLKGVARLLQGFTLGAELYGWKCRPIQMDPPQNCAVFALDKDLSFTVDINKNYVWLKTIRSSREAEFAREFFGLLPSPKY